MKSNLKLLLNGISSLRLTLLCLAAALVLVFAGTLAQVRLGLFFVQEHYFQSWLVWWTASSLGFRVPIFPGGHLVGAALMTNLIAAHLRRFKWSWKTIGIQLTHFGLILLLAGGLATDLFSVSSYMRLKEGETKNYSEDSVRMELVIIDLSKPGAEQVTAIPAELLARKSDIQHESLPFNIIVRGFYPNSGLAMIGREGNATQPASTQGTGARISVKSLPRASRMDERDVVSAVLELRPHGGDSLGTWLVSDAMAAPQTFDTGGRHWSMLLRPTRYYKPYSLTLEDFSHERYPGTQIPKNFSSKVFLSDPEYQQHRQILIYMNHPLRYRGETYYQAGFEPDDSGTILQVVRNPGYQAPYVACVMVGVGMLYHFIFHLAGFARRVKPVASS